jgi:hypothetical protein
MSNNDKPEAATIAGSDVESRLAFADKAETLLRRILGALGYGNGDGLTAIDVLTGITAWLELLLTMQHDPSGGYASFWARMFDRFVAMYPDDKDDAQCAKLADSAANQWILRFPPFLEDERQTYDDKDFADMRAELDRQTMIAGNLERTRDVLLTRNEALELENKSLLATAVDLTNTAERFESERDETRRQLAAAESLAITLAEKFSNEKTRTKDALVPLAKPERLEPGQRWAFVYEPLDSESMRAHPMAMFSNPNWKYLGTDKV